MQDWTALKSVEVDQDSLRMKFSALNVYFNSISFDPLGQINEVALCRALPAP